MEGEGSVAFPCLLFPPDTLTSFAVENAVDQRQYESEDQYAEGKDETSVEARDGARRSQV